MSKNWVGPCAQVGFYWDTCFSFRDNPVDGVNLFVLPDPLGEYGQVRGLETLTMVMMKCTGTTTCDQPVRTTMPSALCTSKGPRPSGSYSKGRGAVANWQCSSDNCTSGVETLVLPFGGTADMGSQSAHWGSFKCTKR